MKLLNNKLKKIIFLAFIFACYPLFTHASDATVNKFAPDIYNFNTQLEHQRFRTLIQQLRCLVCQNQNLADSNAPLAADLRQQVAKMVALGSDDKTIIRYLVERYGDFILYKPPLIKTTFFLWFAPLFSLIIGVLILLVSIKMKKPVSTKQADQQEVEQLLKQVDVAKDET